MSRDLYEDDPIERANADVRDRLAAAERRAEQAERERDEARAGTICKNCERGPEVHFCFDPDFDDSTYAPVESALSRLTSPEREEESLTLGQMYPSFVCICRDAPNLCPAHAQAHSEIEQLREALRRIAEHGT